jgi:ABC-2 type transport system ATP-binding protein
VDHDLDRDVAVDVSGVSKSFGNKTVVDDVSFDVRRGEILGMVGPNGAGKTTTLRMMMDIIKPDAGRIAIFGDVIDERAKNRIGYLPEERGLYRKVTVARSLMYLASLKGMKRGAAEARADELLERVGMLAQKDKKTQELSRGMAQTIQFVSTILHDPHLLVLDEPFSGLDPINTDLLKGLILDLRGQEKCIVLSTHIMNQVEEMCDRVLMIHRGRVVLYGGLDEIKAGYRGNSVFVQCDRLPEGIAGVTKVMDRGRYLELLIEESTSAQDVLRELVSDGVRVDRFEVATPSLNDIFIQVAKTTE